MLNIYYGDMPEAIYNTSIYFKNSYEDKWITDDFAREIIRDIDKSEVISAGAVDSPVLGVIPATKIAGGTKTLILIKNEPDKIFNASTCGDNCAKWILKLASEKDITINLRHLMDFGDEPFEIKVLNTNQVVYNKRELIEAAKDFV